MVQYLFYLCSNCWAPLKQARNQWYSSLVSHGRAGNCSSYGNGTSVVKEDEVGSVTTRSVEDVVTGWFLLQLVDEFQPPHCIFSSLETASKVGKCELFLAPNTSSEACENRGHLRSSSLHEVHEKHTCRGALQHSSANTLAGEDSRSTELPWLVWCSTKQCWQPQHSACPSA